MHIRLCRQFPLLPHLLQHCVATLPHLLQELCCCYLLSVYIRCPLLHLICPILHTAGSFRDANQSGQLSPALSCYCHRRNPQQHTLTIACPATVRTLLPQSSTSTPAQMLQLQEADRRDCRL